MNVVVGAVVAVLLVAVLVGRRRLRQRQTQVQCWHCHHHVDVSEIRWSVTRFNGHQVQLCDRCEPEVVLLPSRPMLPGLTVKVA